MSTSPRLVIHRLFAIAVRAQQAAHELRKVIPNWQPLLEDGFQGRQVLVLRESEMVGDFNCGHEFHIVATGNDGQVRKFFDWSRHSVQAGHISLGDPLKSATTEQYDALVDRTLTTAMPVSFLAGIDRVLRFTVRQSSWLDHVRQERLKMYQNAQVAYPQPSKVSGTGADTWPIHLATDLAEQFYAMLEIHGRQFTGVFNLGEGSCGQDGLQFLATVVDNWQHEFKKIAA